MMEQESELSKFKYIIIGSILFMMGIALILINIKIIGYVSMGFGGGIVINDYLTMKKADKNGNKL
jgi:hypothetical protein